MTDPYENCEHEQNNNDNSLHFTKNQGQYLMFKGSFRGKTLSAFALSCFSRPLNCSLAAPVKAINNNIGSNDVCLNMDKV